MKIKIGQQVTVRTAVRFLSHQVVSVGQIGTVKFQNGNTVGVKFGNIQVTLQAAELNPTT